MLTRQTYEELEIKNLAPYSAKSGESLGRFYEEAEHDYRTRFQRDRDRIIHSTAFRRLEYKTQVFVNHEGDHYRTRLTHSLEVAQIARSMARMLRLNEDLAEAISLAHDLGHTPFGHSGQHIMNTLMKDHEGFEHNKQSIRVVTFFEDRYPAFPGLNLSYEVLEGLSKHAKSYKLADGSLFKCLGSPNLEGQLANKADEIAYNNHDIDDGLRSGMITTKQLENVEIWKTHFAKAKKHYANLPEELLINQTVKSIINTLVMDLVTQTEKNIEAKKIKTISDVRKNGENLVSFSEKIKAENLELKKFLLNNLYRHYRVIRMSEKAEKIISDLFKSYVKNPDILPPTFLERYETVKEKNIQKKNLPFLSSNKKETWEKPSIERIACDYIAGMTDRFALDEYKKLFDPHEKV